MEDFYTKNPHIKLFLEKLKEREFKISFSYFNKERNRWKIKITKREIHISLLKIGGKSWDEQHYGIEVYQPFLYSEYKNAPKEKEQEYELSYLINAENVIEKTEDLSFVTKMILMEDMEKKLNELKKLNIDELHNFPIEIM